jgi:tight adherence protein B
MNILIPALLIFIVAIMVIELFSMAIRNARDPNRGTVRKRLKKIVPIGERIGKQPNLTKQNRQLSTVSFFQKIYESLPGINALNKLLIQADCRYNLGTVVLVSFLLGLVAAIVLRYFRFSIPMAIGAALLIAVIPWLILMRKRHNLFQRFKRQLPEAAGLIARSLRAGHSLPTGMGMVAEEFGSPIGPVFREAIEEINYGGSVTEALKKIGLRFDSQETHFFVMGVALQRETGGNLSEILDNLSRMIRERFRLEAKIKILSTESKWTAWAMAIIPIVLFIILHFINPKHTQFLMEDPTGRTALLIAIIFAGLGAIVMRKMVNFKV